MFQEDFIIGYKPHKEDLEKKETEVFFQPSQGTIKKIVLRLLTLILKKDLQKFFRV